MNTDTAMAVGCAFAILSYIVYRARSEWQRIPSTCPDTVTGIYRMEAVEMFARVRDELPKDAEILSAVIHESYNRMKARLLDQYVWDDRGHVCLLYEKEGGVVRARLDFCEADRTWSYKPVKAIQPRSYATLEYAKSHAEIDLIDSHWSWDTTVRGAIVESLPFLDDAAKESMARIRKVLKIGGAR